MAASTKKQGAADWKMDAIRHNPETTTTTTTVRSGVLFAAVFLLFFAADAVSAREFRIGLWGDNPYAGKTADVFDPGQEGIEGISVGILYARLRDSINSRNVFASESPPAFTFHVGDTKKSSTPCYDSKSFDRFEQLARSTNAPVFLTLGDNDYTDCHTDIFFSFRATNPLTVLRYVRDRFYSKDGRPRLGSNTDRWDTPVTTGGSDFPELQRFIYEDVMFVVVHVTGSNNNLYSTCFDWFGSTNELCPLTLWFSDFCCFRARREYETRNGRVNEFVRESFQSARDANVKGVMLVGQAAIYNLDEFPSIQSDGFVSFQATLEQEARSFGGPVVYVHGDKHRFKHFTPEETGIPNFTVIQVPGDDSIGWVDTTIDADAPTVFSFTHVDLTPPSSSDSFE